jgi:hypothetical protein
MSYYICRRCNHKTKQKNDMKKHLNRIKKCNKNINVIFISDEELVDLSLTKINIQNNQTENIQHTCTQNDQFCTQIKTNVLGFAPECTQIKTNVLGFAHDCTQIKTNVLKSDENDQNLAHNLHTDCTQIKQYCTQNIDDKNNNNTKINNINSEINECELCNRIFTRNSSLKRHQEKYCKNINSSIHKNKPNINISNNTNNNTNNTINNILNINFNIDNKTKNIIPFDEDWDISKIDNETKQLLLMSSIKFTKTMEKILENDANLNILIEKEKNLGIVYKNDTEKFKEMNINDIIDKSMTKLYKHLKQFYDEMKEDNEYKICSDYLDNEKTIIDNKYDEYQNNENTQKIVQNHLIDLYDKNKEKTLNNYKTILESDPTCIDKFIGF